VLAAPGVPVGDYARESLAAAHLLTAAESNVVSNEEDDASVVAKVVSGDADAAIVYASDVTPAVAASIRAIPVPPAVNVMATYPIAVVDGSSQTDLARSFVSYVTGPQGQAALAHYGFLRPG
jgi:molybdate transport system substrate-binding protein